jgi:Tub family
MNIVAYCICTRPVLVLRNCTNIETLYLYILLCWCYNSTTCYLQVFDNGANPRDVDPGHSFAANEKSRQEQGVVMYASNVLGSRGPRKMQVAIPKVTHDGHIVPATPNRPVCITYYCLIMLKMQCSV